MALPPLVQRFSPAVRGEGKIAPFLLPVAGWIDNIVLIGGQQFTYTVPSGFDPSGEGPLGPTGAAFGVNRKASILHISTNGPVVYYNTVGAATIPTQNNLTGEGSIPIAEGHRMIALNNLGTGTVSFISPTNCILSIEAWW